MLYPVYMHKDENSAYSVTVPDFPGCFSAADDMNDLPANVQEAIELYCEGEDMIVPEPTALESLQDLEDYQDGTWLFIDIDLGKLDTRKERINLSVPVWALREIDNYASRIHTTRSGLMVASVIDRIRGDVQELSGGAVLVKTGKAKKSAAKKKAASKRNVVETRKKVKAAAARSRGGEVRVSAHAPARKSGD